MKLRKPTQNFLIDVASLVFFVLMITTGLLIRYTLPPGRGHGSSVFGLTRHDWGDVHFWVSIVLIVLLAVHLLLHWPWIVTMVKGKRPDRARMRVAIGLAGIVGLAILIFSALLVPVERAGSNSQNDPVELEPPSAAANGPSPQATAGVPGREGREYDDDLLDEPRDVPASDAINGSMTVAEISRTTGVPTSYLYEHLKIEAGTDQDEQIGRLKKAYGFSMADVRRACLSYSP